MNLLDPHSLLSHLGPWAVLLVMFAETGLLIGFFLPGDSLLFTAGLLTTTGINLSLPLTLVLAPSGALAGAQVGYLLGRRFGPSLVERPDRPRLTLVARRAREHLDSYGVGRAVVLARFVPGVRTVMNPLAGALRIDSRIFTTWQAIGGAFWTVGLVLAGHLLGSRIPGIDRYLLPVIAVIVVLSLIPIGFGVVRQWRATGSVG
ncbi:membrane-associated protein [Kribbella sp. VKM Ac-2527]|uniref:Membrane-associated protein n=1 Tax=Kribbella caucasensis TaxID=2512215 RepID=A0A4V3CAQ3_9ACTN|nr:DedA family protein [Kribbella sp. VKM Ac-2527]TDO51762.1 membrane-associated protein [Kribbella sp. VKM Ac-2527]